MRYPDSKNKNSIQDGLEFQDVVMETLAQYGVIIQNYSSRKYQFEHGENRQGWEIKRDNWCTKSGRLSIEIAERTAVDKPWVDSGIYSGKHWVYIQGNKACFWLFFTSFLQKLHKSKQKDYEEKEESTVRTFYLPVADADKYGHRFDIEGNGNRIAF